MHIQPQFNVAIVFGISKSSTQIALAKPASINKVVETVALALHDLFDGDRNMSGGFGLSGIIKADSETTALFYF